ncbi:phage tail assembly chaperone [uncultured Clostridium sp.]|uniref:phage tail assembly chaperone n=1 Tax=uncultured Clostridium sp. TaxID=59620 RepID=UPI0028E8593D|nr:hypothetical protein [uncultured Clostridium sp.]
MENTEKIMEMKEKDILSKLMGTYEVPTATVLLDRIGIPLKLKGLSSKEISSIRKECTYTRKVKGKFEEKFDGSEFDAGLVVAATTNFKWNSKELLDYHKASDAKQLIRKMLLAGEISLITDKIMEVSGYNDDLEEIEDIKNS